MATMTVVDYLYMSRETWFKCVNPGSGCCGDTDELRIKEALDEIPIETWAEIHPGLTKDTGWIELIQHTAEDWDELVGPKAQATMMQEAVDFHLDQAAQYIAMQASKERLSSE